MVVLGVDDQVKESEQVPVTRTIEEAKGANQTLDVQGPVRALNTEASAGHDQMHMKH